MKPIITIVGKSDSGKTTLMEKLIRELFLRGYKVGTVKHDVHGFEMDHKGKDSYRHKHAGAHTTLISSPNQIGMIKDTQKEESLEDLLYYFQDVDIVLAEGYKKKDYHKIEVHRQSTHRDLLCDPNKDKLLAIATDEVLPIAIPQFDINDAKGLADLIEKQFIIQYKPDK